MKYDMKYIFRRVLTFFIIFVLLSFIKSCEVKAETIKVDHNYVTINDSNWYTNYGYYGMNFNTSGTGFNFKIQMSDTKFWINNEQQYIDPDYFTMVATDFCFGSSINKLERYNNYGDSCPNSCYTQTPFLVYMNASCKYDNTHEGFLYRLYFPILKWQKYNNGGILYYIVNDKMKITPTNYNTSGTFTNVYLTTELPIPDSIDTINSQINSLNNTSHQDSINTQNAINNASSQAHQDAQQAHQDSQNINNSINNSNTSSSENQLSGIFNNSAFNDSSGIQNIIELPLNFIRGLGTTCQPISLTIPYINTNVNLPCIKQELNNRVPTIVNVLSITINGFIVYRLLIEIVSLIKAARNPEDDRLEVLDL